MERCGKFVLESVYEVMKKVKILKKKEKHLKALGILEDLLRNSKKKFYLEAGKITCKALGICLKLLNKEKLKVQILKRADSVIVTYLAISAKKNLNVSEKTVQRILICFNFWTLFYRTSNNLSMVLTYERKVVKLVKNRSENAETYQMLAKFYLNLGSVYLEVRNFKEAINFVEEALKYLQNAVSVKSDQCEDIKINAKEGFKDVSFMYVLSFYCISIAQERLENKDLALDTLKKAAEIGEKCEEKYEVYEMVVKRLENLQKLQTNLNEKVLFHLSLNESIKSFEFYDKNRTELRNYERKIPGRYYTRSQLVAKEKVIRNQSQLHFVSADQYFFNAISSSINIKSNVKHLNLLRDPNSGWTQQENIEKQKISELRSKRNLLSNSCLGPASPKNVKHSELNTQTSKTLKIDNILSSNRFKELIVKVCSFNKPQKKILPSQKLFFKPKNFRSERFEKSFITEAKSILDTQKRQSVYESTKDEIADFIENINKEIRMLYPEKPNSKFPTPTSTKSPTQHFLRRSTKPSSSISLKTLPIPKSQKKSNSNPHLYPHN